MPNTRRKKKRKKVRYSKITFKLSLKQKKSLVNYCRARQTTPTKLVKKSIKRYINGFDKNVPEEYYVTENQLDLFEAKEDKKQHPEVGNQKPEFESRKLEGGSGKPEIKNAKPPVKKKKLRNGNQKFKSNTLTFDF